MYNLVETDINSSEPWKSKNALELDTITLSKFFITLKYFNLLIKLNKDKNLLINKYGQRKQKI